MKISQETKMQVNRYFINNFPNRGYIGYVYAKKMLEVTLQNYIETGNIESITITDLMRAADIKVSYQACRNAIKYFLAAANLDCSFSDFIIDAVEQIIENRSKYLVEDQDQGEEF